MHGDMGTEGHGDRGTQGAWGHGDTCTGMQGRGGTQGHGDATQGHVSPEDTRGTAVPQWCLGPPTSPTPPPAPRPVSCVLPQVVYKNNDFKLELSRLAQEGDARVSLHGDLLFGCRPVPAPEPVTFGSPRAFLALPPPWRAARAGSVSFDFRTTEPNGLLLLGRGRPGGPRPGYLALELLDGHLYLLLDMGGGGGGLRLRASARKVTDGEWCHVDVQRDGRRGERGWPRGARGR